MKHSSVRQNIVETAAHLFYNNGYNLTGINEIIREAGIAKATLYNHFKSKDDLCVAYLQYKNATFLFAIDKYTKEPAAGIVSLFDFLIEFYESDAFNGCWCINTISELPKNNMAIRKEIQVQKLQFLNFIEKLVGSNVTAMEEVNLKILAKQIYLLYEGAVSESHIHQKAWPIRIAKDMCDNILSHYQ